MNKKKEKQNALLFKIESMAIHWIWRTRKVSAALLRGIIFWEVRRLLDNSMKYTKECTVPIKMKKNKKQNQATSRFFLSFFEWISQGDGLKSRWFLFLWQIQLKPGSKTKQKKFS